MYAFTLTNEPSVCILFFYGLPLSFPSLSFTFGGELLSQIESTSILSNLRFTSISVISAPVRTALPLLAEKTKSFVPSSIRRRNVYFGNVELKTVAHLSQFCSFLLFFFSLWFNQFGWVFINQFVCERSAPSPSTMSLLKRHSLQSL